MSIEHSNIIIKMEFVRLVRFLYGGFHSASISLHFVQYAYRSVNAGKVWSLLMVAVFLLRFLRVKNDGFQVPP